MKLIHISDIHIGSGRRSKEYREIFDKLENEIKLVNPEIICITGDIFHYKVKYSGEDVDDFYYLMRKLSNENEARSPTERQIIIIPGNHDMNMNDKSIIKRDEK